MKKKINGPELYPKPSRLMETVPEDAFAPARAYLLTLESKHSHDQDQWLGIFTNPKALQAAYEEAKNHPSPDWEPFVKPAIYGFPPNTLITDLLDPRIQRIPEEKLPELVRTQVWLREARNEGFVHMDIRFDTEKLESAGLSVEEILAPYEEYCQMYGITCPKPGIFQKDGEDAMALISKIMFQIETSDHLELVASWYWWVSGEWENLLETAWKWRARLK